MEYDTKTREQWHTLLQALHVLIARSAVEHSGQELVRLLLGQRPMASDPGM